MSFSKKVFLNGKIFTSNKNQKWAEAIVVVMNKIIFVGTNEKAKEFIDANTEVIDLQKNLVLPGFIDSHAHLVLGGFYLHGIDLSTAKSKKDFQDIFKSFVNKHTKSWIKGGNWNHQIFDKIELPSKEWIDEITRDIPVFVHRMDYHMALANSAALKLAGITKDSISPEGGTIERDQNGNPTGIFKDKAMDFIYRILPEPTSEDYQAAISTALRETAKYGITCVNDISYKNHFKEFQKTFKSGKLNCRIYSILPIEKHNDLISVELSCPFGNDKIKIGGMKAFADGSLGSSTALMFEPYSDNLENKGLEMDILHDGRLESWAMKCDENNLQLIIHAIGDKAISDVLDIYENIYYQNPKKDRRLRIEHAQHMHKKDFERFSRLNVVASMQPYHLFDDGSWAESKIGSERLKTTYAFKSFLDNNIRLAFGSDWPVSSLNPIEGIFTAVTRNTSDNDNPNGLNPEQKISVEDAIYAYTINAAYSCFSESSIGSIEANKLADFIVLTKNLFDINHTEINEARVKMTIFDGEIIYQSE